jgi:hypothetical protein
LAPAVETRVTATGEDVELVTVTVCAALAVPSG